MVNINFIGRLGADAEIKTNSKTNEQFLRLRVVSNEKYNGVEVPSWFGVYYESKNVAKLQQYLTKGRLVEIHGIERISMYTDKNGVTQVSRDVSADRIDFISTGNSTANSQSSSTPMTPEALVQAAISRETEKNATIEAMKRVDATQISQELPF